MLHFNESHQSFKKELITNEENKNHGNTIKSLYEYNYYFSKEKRTVNNFF